MDYAKHYWTLIDRARNRRLTGRGIERHHILPKCMGGGNEDANIAWLRPEEHYVAHLLLARMHQDSRKLAYARVSMKRRAGCGFAGSENKRYAKGMERRQSEWLKDWRNRRGHRCRKKRYKPADLERMREILTPRAILS